MTFCLECLLKRRGEDRGMVVIPMTPAAAEKTSTAPWIRWPRLLAGEG